MSRRKRIATVLKVRNLELDQAKAALALANAAERRTRDTIATLTVEAARWGNRPGAQSSGSFRTWRSQLDAVKRNLDRLRDELQVRIGDTAVAREVYLDAARRVEALERLDARLAERERLEEERLEQAAADEAAANTHLAAQLDASRYVNSNMSASQTAAALADTSRLVLMEPGT